MQGGFSPGVRVTMAGSAMALRRTTTSKASACMACGKLTSTTGNTVAKTAGLDIGSATQVMYKHRVTCSG
jgi:hypothetical protein